MNTLIKGPVSQRATNIFNHTALDRSAKVSSHWNIGRSSPYGAGPLLTVHFAGMLHARSSTPEIRHDVTYFPDLIATSGRRIFANYWYGWERGGISHS